MAGVMRVLVVSLLVASASAFAEDPLPTAKELALRLREYQSSIKSLRVRYRTRQLPAAGPDGEIVSPGYPWREMLWVKDGQKEYLGELPQAGAPATAARLVASFDGREGYMAVHFGTDPADLRSIVIERERPGRLEVLFPRLLGWRIPIVNETLVSLLERPGEKPISWSDRFEAPCVQCDLGYLSEGLGSEHVVKAWFDPESGWLPKFILILPRAIDEASLAGEPIPKPIPPFVFSAPSVDAFTSGKDLRAGVDRVFPGTCSGYNPDRTREPTFEVHQVEFNARIDQSLFKPEIPPGTEVIRNEKNGRVTRDITGSAEDVAKFKERVQANDYPGTRAEVPKPVRPTAEEANSVSARPSDAAGTLWNNPLIWITVMLASAALAFVLKQRG